MRHTVLLLLVLAPAALSQCPSYDTLERTEYLPQPRDCSSFWRCEAGRLVPGRCPPGRHFLAGSMTCGEPALSGCRPSPGDCTAADTCSYWCTCLRAQHRSVCPFRVDFPAEVHVFDLPLQPACAAEPSSFQMEGNKLGLVVARNATATVAMCDLKAGQTHAPHFVDCSRGVLCSREGEAPLSCPAGSHYDPGSGRCNSAEHVECTTPRVPPGPAGCTQDAALSTCRHTCTCEVLRGSCPARVRFSSTLGVFDARLQPDCLTGPATIELDKQFIGTLAVHPDMTKVNHCPYSQDPKIEYFPDPSDCQKMFQCSRGRETSLSCPRDRHFNPATGKCGYPDPAICKTAAPPATQPPLPQVQVAVDNLACPTTAVCPAGSRGRVAHLTDCTFFCKCVQGTPVLRACPPGLHFNANTQLCDAPPKAGCKTFCHRLTPSEGGSWSRRECVTSESLENEECRLECNSNRQLIGSEVIRCTEKGWHGTGGLSIIPSCKTSQEVGIDIIHKINETLEELNKTGQHAAFLFVLDESKSVRTTNFQIEKDFVSALVDAFPLSEERAAGVVSFSKLSAVDINLNETSTCNFLSRLSGIRYSSGSTDIARVLETAIKEINTHAANKTTLVFLITDGKSQTDPVAAADVLRSQNRILFIIGVARYERKQVEPISSNYKDGSKLFFGLPNFRVFKVVSDYLKTTYTLGASQECLEQDLLHTSDSSSLHL